MKIDLKPTNFVYPQEKPEEYRFGSQQLGGVVLNESGDWRAFTPEPEEQNKRGVESSACFVESHQKTIATILEEQFGIPNSDFSARFNLIFSNATRQGGSPIDSAQSIRHDGLIPDSMLPFDEQILSWDEFNSWKGGDEKACINWGQSWLRTWKPQYDIVFRREESVEVKYKKLKEALKYSPCPVSVYAWVTDDKGQYVKPQGSQDNHLTTCVYVDEQNRAYVWDTYSPFLKVLEPFYNFEFGMRWSIDKAPKKKTYWWTDLIKKLLWK